MVIGGTSYGFGSRKLSHLFLLLVRRGRSRDRTGPDYSHSLVPSVEVDSPEACLRCRFGAKREVEGACLNRG